MHPEILISALTGEASKEELARLAAWRAESPANEAEYLRLARLWTAAGQVASGRARPALPQVHTIVEMGERRTVDTRKHATVPLPDEASARVGGGTAVGKKRARWVSAAVVASLVVGLGLRWVMPERDGENVFRAETFVTGPMQTATVTLRDGTVVQLAPDSRLEFSDDDAPREVALEGRAFFAVPPGRDRPFRVRSAAGAIEVHGTRFDVQSRQQNLEVAVVEGVVQIVGQRGNAQVTAGEIGRGAADGPLRVEEVEDIYASLAWLGSFLAFQATPVRQATEEIERRFGVVFQIDEPVLLERTLTGWFVEPTVEEIIGTVCSTVGAVCTAEGPQAVRMTLPDGRP